MPTIEEVLAYLGIDYADDMVNKNIERSIATADAYLKGSIANNSCLCLARYQFSCNSS